MRRMRRVPRSARASRSDSADTTTRSKARLCLHPLSTSLLLAREAASARLRAAVVSGCPVQAHVLADNCILNGPRKHECLKRSTGGPNMEGMKLRLFLLAVVLSHTACITVEDFGAYWDKAGTDGALAGTWKQVPSSPEQTRARGYGIGNTLELSVK